MEDLKKLMAEDPEAACFYVESPNYYGNLEDVEAMAEIVHAQGAKLVLGIDPIAQAVIKTPRELGADIAVGDGQPLGMPIAFGGPYVGIMATTTDMMRKLPGRIVGETKDHDGNRAYVLTLQAREQHIRREKASSNICSNQDLCALTASVYMAAMGPDGMKEVAEQTMAKAHFLRDELVKAGLTQKNCQGEFFNEFVTDCPMGAEALMAALDEKGILGGLPLDGDTILWCATEVNSRSAMEEVADTVQSLMKGKEA
jgi:glycine dehydrogenase subunit 1